MWPCTGLGASGESSIAPRKDASGVLHRACTCPWPRVCPTGNAYTPPIPPSLFRGVPTKVRSRTASRRVGVAAVRQGIGDVSDNVGIRGKKVVRHCERRGVAFQLEVGVVCDHFPNAFEFARFPAWIGSGERSNQPAHARPALSCGRSVISPVPREAWYPMLFPPPVTS